MIKGLSITGSCSHPWLATKTECSVLDTYGGSPSPAPILSLSRSDHHSLETSTAGRLKGHTAAPFTATAIGPARALGDMGCPAARF